MHPVLFDIGPLTLHSYGAGVGAACLFGMWLCDRLTRDDPRFAKDFYYLLGLFTVPGAVIGSRLEYVRQHWAETFAHDPAAIFDVAGGGVVLHGGMIGGVLGALIAVLIKRAPLWATLDGVAVAFGWGIAIARLGCFGAGCCYGDPTEMPWGVLFDHPDSVAPGDTPRHPTQLYAVGFGLLLGPFLTWLYTKRRFEGQITVAAAGLYPLFRIVNEVFRGDGERGWLIEGLLTPAQGFSLALATAALIVGVVLARRAKGSNPSPG